jgi:hypothetical protein
MGMDSRVHKAGRRRQLVCSQGEPRDDTEGPSAATFQRPEQVGIGRCVGDPHRTVGGHDFGFEEAGGRRSVEPRIASEPAAENETGDANRQAAAALNQAGAFRGHRVIDMAPDGPRPHRDRREWSGFRARRNECVVQLDPGHAAGPDQQ